MNFQTLVERARHAAVNIQVVSQDICENGEKKSVEFLMVKDVAFDLVAHLKRQQAFSERTFGPATQAGHNLQGNLDHIRKELTEIEAKPDDLSEWIDVVLLAFDGAWRQGATAEQIVAALAAKQEKNERRQWPDWRTAPKGQAIQHIKTEAS